MTKDELLALSDDELLALSLEKNSKGNATSKALEAQKLIWENGGMSYYHRMRGTVNVGEGNRCSKSYKYYENSSKWER